MVDDLCQHVAQVFLPGRCIDGRDETVRAVASLNRARYETRHVQTGVAQHVQQIREYAGACAQRYERDDRFVFRNGVGRRPRSRHRSHGLIPTVRDARSRSTVMASSRGASARNSVRAGIVAHGAGDARQIVQIAADARYRAPPGRAQGLGRRHHSTMPAAAAADGRYRETAALRQPVRMGGDGTAIGE